MQATKNLKLEPLSPRFVKTLVHPERKAFIASVHFFAQGTKLAAAGYPSGVVQVFDVHMGQELRRINSPPGYRGTAEYAIFTPDFGTLFVPVDRRKSVPFEQDGKKQYRIEYNGELLAWDLNSGFSLPSIPPSAPGRGVVAGYMSSTGDKLVTVEFQGYMSRDRRGLTETFLWDLTSQTVKSLGKGYGMAAFSDDGRQLATALFATQTELSSLTITDLESGQEQFRKESKVKNRGFSSPCFSPDGKILAVHESAGLINQPEAIRFYDTGAGKELGIMKSDGAFPFMLAAFSPDGNRLAACDYHGTLTIFDVRRMQVARTYPFGGLQAGLHVAFSPDSKCLVAMAWPKMDRFDLDLDPADSPQTRLFLFDLVRSGEPEILICPQGYCQGLAFSPDGKLLAVGGMGGVHLFDVSKQKTPHATASAAISHSQDAKSGGIDPATVAAYEKLGAEYGGWVKIGKGRAFQAGHDKAVSGLPGFRLRAFPKGKLRAVGVPFGLDLSFSNVNPAELNELVALKNLVLIDLRYTKTADQDLKKRAGMNKLASLNLCHTRVTDAGLKELACHKNLTKLNLTGTDVTDEGLKELADFNRLASLYLENTRVTNEGVSQLRKALPRCEITYRQVNTTLK